MVDIEVLAAAYVEGDAGATQGRMPDHVVIAKTMLGIVKLDLEWLAVRCWGIVVSPWEILLAPGDVEQETRTRHFLLSQGYY